MDANLRQLFADALARRAAQHSGAVRARLQARLAALREAPPVPAPEPAVAVRPHAGALAALAARLGERPAALSVRRGAARGAALATEPELLQFFRSTWSRLDTERRLNRSLAQAPENPGPLNSQHLVHQALLLMRETSPDYLRHFMAQVDALMWIDQAQTEAVPAKAAAKPKAKPKAGGRKPRPRAG